MPDLSFPGLEAFLTPAASAAPAVVEVPPSHLMTSSVSPAVIEAWTEPPPPTPVLPALIAGYAAPTPPAPAAPEPPKNKGGRPKSPWLKRHEEEKAAQQQSLEDAIVELALDPEGRAMLLKQLAADHARGSFAEFFRQAWKVLEPTTELLWNWHLQLMCNVAQAVFVDWLRAKKNRKYLNKVRNVLVNVPPGSSKSKIFSVCFQAWCWLHFPGMKFICLSVNEDAAMRDARDMRTLVRSDWYVDSFRPDWHIKDDQDAVSNYGNSAGGARLSMPSRSVVVGLRADLITIDDANDPTETEKERKEVNSIWDNTQSNRVNDLQRSMRFGIQQRTGAGDWSDHVVEKQGTWAPDNLAGWLHVVLPAEFEAARKFALPQPLIELLAEQQLPLEEWITEDPRTIERETLDKERLTPQSIEDQRKAWEGTGNFAAQMQQRPAMLEGARVRRDYWGWFRLERGVRGDIDDLDTGRPRPEHCIPAAKMPAMVVRAAVQRPGCWDFDWLVISLDCAAKKTDRGSNWGILVVAGKDGRRYVLDDRTKRGDILEIIEILRSLIRIWKPDRILIEDKAAGPDLRLRLDAEMRKGDMPTITLEAVKVGNDGKEARLDACISVIANGNVLLLDGAPWLDAFVAELAMFPFGQLSDRVDALTQVLNHFKEYEGDSWPEL